MRRRWIPGVFLAAVALAGLPTVVTAQTEVVSVDGVRREIPVLERQGRRFVALDQIGRLLDGAVRRGDGERAVLTVDGVDLVVLRRVPYVRFDGRWFQMSEPAQRDASGFWLPASALHQLLPVLFPGRFPSAARAPRRPAETSADDRRPAEGGIESGTIGAVDVRVEPGRTRLGFRFGTVPQIDVDDAVPGALQLRIAGSTVTPAVAAGLSGLGLVDSVSVSETDAAAVLTLWLDRRASMYSVASLERPAGMEVVLLTADPGAVRRLAAAGASRRARDDSSRRREGIERSTPGREGPEPAVERPTPRLEPATPRGDTPTARPSGSRSGKWTVVVDAGHGGHDPGASGPSGTREKDVNLAVARRLAHRLEDTGAVDVVLTRADDTFVALGERRKIANRADADLFVSIHANAADSPSAEGFETYYLSTAKTAQALEVARRENASIRYENPEIDPESLDELNFILWDLAQNEFFRESSVLAQTVQEELDRRMDLRSRGVKQAPFFVLNGTFMPAILFETAFITNPREEALLNDPSFQTRLVDGLAGSILAYLDRYGRKIVAPTAAR